MKKYRLKKKYRNILKMLLFIMFITLLVNLGSIGVNRTKKIATTCDNSTGNMCSYYQLAQFRN